MIWGQLALVAAALFAGAAFYVCAVEHPARRSLSAGARPDAMEARLSARRRHAGEPCADRLRLGLFAWWQTGGWLWALGAVVLVANWPYTLVVIMPTNRKLKAIDPEKAGAESQALLDSWARLHMVRTGARLRGDPASSSPPRSADARLRLQHRVPVEIVEPALVQVVGREQPAVVVQVVHASARRAPAAATSSRPWQALLPFFRLQGAQAATTFAQVVWPPRERGTTWSKVRSSSAPQYWHWKRSRRNTLKRVKAGWRDGWI